MKSCITAGRWTLLSRTCGQNYPTLLRAAYPPAPDGTYSLSWGDMEMPPGPRVPRFMRWGTPYVAVMWDVWASIHRTLMPPPGHSVTPRIFLRYFPSSLDTNVPIEVSYAHQEHNPRGRRSDRPSEQGHRGRWGTGPQGRDQAGRTSLPNRITLDVGV